MTANDFFYVALGTGFLILVAGMTFIAVQISGILQDIKKITGDISELTSDVATLKDGIKIAILRLVEKIIARTGKGGELKNSNDK